MLATPREKHTSAISIWEYTLRVALAYTPILRLPSYYSPGRQSGPQSVHRWLPIKKNLLAVALWGATVENDPRNGKIGHALESGGWCCCLVPFILCFVPFSLIAALLPISVSLLSSHLFHFPPITSLPVPLPLSSSLPPPRTHTHRSTPP